MKYTLVVRVPFVLISVLVLFGYPVFGQEYRWFGEGGIVRTHSFDSVQHEAEVRRFMQESIYKGYIYTRIDSIVNRGNSWDYYFHFGSREKWRLRKVRINGEEKSVSNKRDLKKLLDQEINNGFPFAELEVIQIRRDGPVMLVDLRLRKNAFIANDTLLLAGDADVSLRYLWNLLDLRPASPYSERSFQKIEPRMSSVPFLLLNESPDVGFSNNRAKVYLNIDEVRMSTFDGIVGLLQNDNSKNVITGYLDLSLFNLFRSGKYLRVNWHHFDLQSQTLDIGYSHPYLFQSSLQLDFGLSLLKQDTSFLNREISLGLRTKIGARTDIRFSVVGVRSNLAEREEGDDLVDFSTTWYAIGLDRDPVNIRHIRQSGFNFNVGLQLGQRTISESNTNNSVAGESLSVKGDGQIFTQLTFGKSSAVTSTTTLKLIRNKNQLRNEFFRVGGLQTMRGFNENEFFASTVISEQVELRQYFESRSYVLVFADVGFIERGTSGYTLLAGTGAGMVLRTGNGLFNFIFATGVSQQDKPSINEIKIHFGYTSYF